MGLSIVLGKNVYVYMFICNVRNQSLTLTCTSFLMVYTTPSPTEPHPYLIMVYPTLITSTFFFHTGTHATPSAGVGCDMGTCMDGYGCVYWQVSLGL